MKKTLFAIGAMVAMVACSNDFVVKEAAQEAIGFDNAFVDNSTRSVVDPSFSNSKMFDKFHVYGYVEGAPLFNDENTIDENDGVTVTGQGRGEQGTWSYSGTQYWIAGAHYNFSAVAPAASTVNPEWTKTAADKDKTTLSFTNNGTTDLLYAQNDTYTAKTDGTPNGKVGFTFRHVLSKVKFSFENAYDATNSTICVRGIQITNADATAVATLTSDSAAWGTYNGEVAIAFGNATTEEDYRVEDDVDNSNKYDFEFEGIVESYFERFVIPAQKVWNITFIVDLLVNGQVIKTYNHVIELNAKFEPGKSYDLKAVIDPEHIDPDNEQEPIEFTVTAIENWVEQGEQNI